MRAQTLPGTAGLQWIIGGFALFRRSPPLLGMLVLTYWLTVLFLNIIPFLGAVIASLAIPGLSVGLMQASRNIERGQPIGVQTLFGGLRQNPRTLVALGAFYLCCTLGVLGLSALVDGGDLVRFMLSSSRDERAALAEADLSGAAMFVMLLMTPVMMAYWFAPVLAAWHGLSLSKSLFFSFMACKLNWRPFLAYGAVLMLVAGILPGVLLGILLVLFPTAQNLVMALVVMPLVLIVAPAVFASFYVCYRDIFGVSEIA